MCMEILKFSGLESTYKDEYEYVKYTVPVLNNLKMAKEKNGTKTFLNH